MTPHKGNIRTGELLPVLDRATHEELEPIVAALGRSFGFNIKDDPQYESCRHNLTLMTFSIANELCCAGGNSFVNFVRGWGMDPIRGFGWDGAKGPPYSEVLHDVCRVMNVRVERRAGVLANEEKLLRDVVERVWNEMAPKEREEVVRAAEAELKNAGKKFEAQSGSKLWTLPFGLLAAQIGARLAGFIVYQVAVQVANAAARQLLGQGLKFATNAAIARAVSVAIGPAGWAFSILWAAADLAGPSYRALAPAVFHVAVLRQSMLWAGEEDMAT
jgi:uncharacterized protein YaaW (UPF0174 family)